MIGDVKNILVFFSFKNHKYGYIEMLFSRLSRAAQTRQLRLFRGSLKELHIEITNNKMRIVESMTGRSLDSFDAVYFELWYKARQQALAAARYCQRHRIAFFCNEVIDLDPDTKIGEMAVLSDNDIPLPNSFTSSKNEIKRLFRHQPPIGYPLVVKSDDDSGGENNFLAHNYKELKKILDDNPKLTFIIQEFIPNDFDYRCLVLGGEIKFILKRTRAVDSEKHTNNTSSGAEGEAVALNTISESAKRIVVKAAKLLGRDSFAGVDLIINKQTGRPYILEVNQTPQIETGAEIDKKMAVLLDYVEKIAK
jgi:glutathione synthase/RimK-type ligase-like ATP-grasp enzyme